MRWEFQSELTELCEINARSVSLNFNFRAHFPEDCEEKCDDAKEDENNDPDYL